MVSGALELTKVWKSPQDLLTSLNEEGFEARFPSESAQAQVELHWSKLRVPCSAQAKREIDESCYCFLNSKLRSFEGGRWGLVLADPKLEKDLSKASALIISKNSDAAMDFILRKCFPASWSGKSEKAPSHVQVEAGVVIGPGCEFGEGVVLESGVRLGAHVRVGKGTRLCSGVSVADFCEIGQECLIKSQASIGGDGFGHVMYPRTPRAVLRKHVGRVLIGDHCTVGSFVAIDRGVFEDTRIGNCCAIDNLVQIAHNCEIGDHSILCSQVGLSGSVTLGSQVVLAGQVGVKDHIVIGDQVTVTAKSGVSAHLEPKQVVKGYPPRPLQEALKREVFVGKIPEIYERLKALEKKLDS